MRNTKKRRGWQQRWVEGGHIFSECEFRCKFCGCTVEQFRDKNEVVVCPMNPARLEKLGNVD